MAADACGNAAMAEKARGITRDLENGAGLTESLAKTQYFPGVALQMMRTGEESGNLDAQLDKVADFLEQDAETTIRQSVKVLGYRRVFGHCRLHRRYGGSVLCRLLQSDPLRNWRIEPLRSCSRPFCNYGG
jgi:hypothetical protein